jgi:hypothetical protein
MCIPISFFNCYSAGGGFKLGAYGTGATNRPIVPAPGDYDDGEIGGTIDRGNRSTRRKPASMPLCPLKNLTCYLDANPGSRGGKPASKRVSYGTASPARCDATARCSRMKESRRLIHPGTSCFCLLW